MQILELITEHMAGSRCPLIAVTLAAVPCPDTPVILTLHWHGFVKEPTAERDETDVAALKPVPSTALQLNDRWTDLLDLDFAAMEAGWELGAWDVVRAERRACMRPGASAREALDCVRAFAASPMQYQGVEMTLAEAADADELVKVAAQSGYLCWEFRPVHGGIWRDVSDDTSLDCDGKRAPHCPYLPVRPHCAGAHRTVYRFGTLPAGE